MKILNFLFGHAAGQFQGLVSSSILVAVDDLLIKGKTALRVIMLSLICSLCLTAGIVISFLNVSAQYDVSGSILLTATLIGGLVLIVLASLGLAAIFWTGPRNSRQDQAAKVEAHSHREQPALHSSPLEEALAVAVMELVDHFKQRKAAKEDITAGARNHESDDDSTRVTH